MSEVTDGRLAGRVTTVCFHSAPAVGEDMEVSPESKAELSLWPVPHTRHI